MSNEQSVPLVLALDDPAATLEQVGGKGASLARLAAVGLPVPPGFHITTAAYRYFVTENGLQEQILATVSAVTADQPNSLEESSRKIDRMFAQGSMPAEIAEAIRQAYVALGGDDLSVAVRSSATAEDLPELSFAGQQDTYLNMRGEAMVLDAIKRCWASLWTARAIGYRARSGIAHEEVSLAVVVQELVLADAAGILFTVQARPITALSKTAGSQVTRPPEWKLPKAKGKYIRASVIELLPDPLSPLFATLGLPAWNRAMHRFALASGIGNFVGDMLTTINGYAFYDLRYRTALMKPRVLTTVAPRLMYTSQQRWEQEARPAYTAVVER